jgi:glutamate-ammonia-ligase adenylyltransferase
VCDGRRGLSNEQFFTRLARLVINSLSKVTADGFCFRVDTRLRPFGDSGPLVSSFAALEQYYQREGRNWERYALIKARPVAGDQVAGEQLLRILTPFVYRRYIDFGAIEALREMHQSVREDAQRHDRLHDIKRGPGGIRELEFLVQTFQLLRGGRDVALQTPSIFAAAAELQNLGLLPESAITRLLSAYRFLRQVENRIQALHDQQTHTVPAGQDGLMVAQAMGFETAAEFQTALGETRNTVQSLFEQSLPQPSGPVDEKNPWKTVWQQARNNIRDANSEATDWKPLAGFVKRLNRLSLSQRASRRLDEYMPVLLQRITSFSPTDEEANRVFDLLSAICRRSAYLSLLLHNPQATDRMLKLFSASKRVANAVTRHPALLDELIDPRLVAYPPGERDIKDGVERILGIGSDTETALQNLNYHKHAVSLRIAVAALRSTITVNEAQSALSLLAESLIAATLKLSLDEMKARHGCLPGPELAVIAYGSLGAMSLGFDSDLDLIFLYTPQTKHSDGKRPIHAERYHTGVARRLLSLLSAITPSGRLYSIDARLRPNGKAGLLVSSLDSFSRYQQTEAWVWELQALTRARPVAGDAGVMKGFSAARRLALTTARDMDTIRQDVVNMRQRVSDQPGNTEPVKYAPGGRVDIEFVVQLGLLLNSENSPDITNSTRLSLQLRALQVCGWLDFDAMQTLDNAYTQICQARQLKALKGEGVSVDATTLLSIARPLCNEILG